MQPPTHHDLGLPPHTGTVLDVTAAAILVLVHFHLISHLTDLLALLWYGMEVIERKPWSLVWRWLSQFWRKHG